MGTLIWKSQTAKRCFVIRNLYGYCKNLSQTKRSKAAQARPGKPAPPSRLCRTCRRNRGADPVGRTSPRHPPASAARSGQGPRCQCLDRHARVSRTAEPESGHRQHAARHDRHQHRGDAPRRPRCGVERPDRSHGQPAGGRRLYLAIGGGAAGLVRRHPFPPDAGIPAAGRTGLGPRGRALWVGLNGFEPAPDDIVVTSGAQHALLAVVSSLIEPGDVIAPTG